MIALEISRRWLASFSNFSSSSSSVNFCVRRRMISRAWKKSSRSTMPLNAPSARIHRSGGFVIDFPFSFRDLR